MTKFALLNTAILTCFGSFKYTAISVEAAKVLIAENGYQSFIGHQGTADILTDLLGVKVDFCRDQYKQNVGDSAIVFKLRGRAPEGVILSRDEVEKIGYDLGVLSRIE